MLAVLFLCFLGLYVAPKVLGGLAKSKLEEAKNRFAECSDGTPLLREAENYLRVQQAIPLWSTHAQVMRLQLGDAVGEVGSCEGELAVKAAVSALSYLDQHPTSLSLTRIRERVDNNWMEQGNLQAIVLLAKQHPGEHTHARRKAHLLLGQLAQAAKLEPKSWSVFDNSNAVLLCLIGNTEAALERFAQEKSRLPPQGDNLRHSNFVGAYAECLLRAQKYEPPRVYRRPV